jgi:co-chaperonin GroES (HSP10)
MWKTNNNRVIVELDGIYDKVIAVGDFVLKLDHVFRKLHNAVQKAKVVACPEGTELMVGDTVYVHHFVVEEERIVPVKDKEYRWLEYNQIYARVRDGILKALGYYVLVEPVKFDESKFKKKTDFGLVLTQKAGTEYVERVGTVLHVGDEAAKEGIEVGDKIFFNKNCEYEITIEGELMYRMEKRDVIAVIDPEIEFTV